MRELKKNEQYATEILISINNLIHEEEQQQRPCHINIKELAEGKNLTEFFIGYLKAGTLTFNEFTGQDKNNLEFTHILNQLCVQDLIEPEEEKRI